MAGLSLSSEAKADVAGAMERAERSGVGAEVLEAAWGCTAAEPLDPPVDCAGGVMVGRTSGGMVAGSVLTACGALVAGVAVPGTCAGGCGAALDAEAVVVVSALSVTVPLHVRVLTDGTSGSLGDGVQSPLSVMPRRLYLPWRLPCRN